MWDFRFENRVEITRFFVFHCVVDIHENSNPDQWRYYPTKLNPADKATRGLTVHELVTDDCLWKGPEFLNKPEDDWPKKKFGNSLEACKKIKAGRRDRVDKPAIQVIKS